MVWSTPDVDEVLAYIARVSNPAGQDKAIGKLLVYMMEHGHVSPFGMANACIEITTTRDIGRQIMRHWSMYFHELEMQEFSQRYQSADALPLAELRECRMQDVKNRQSSFICSDDNLAMRWYAAQEQTRQSALHAYEWALENGIAKEVARAVLPEGLTSTRFYLNGNFRSWIFFLKSRLHESAQKEVRMLCEEILELLRQVAPVTIGAFFK